MAKNDTKETSLYDLVILRNTFAAGADGGKYRNRGDVVKGVDYRDAMILMGDTGGNNNKAAMVDSHNGKACLAESKGSKKKESAPAE